MSNLDRLPAFRRANTSPTSKSWGVVASPLFDNSLIETRRVFSDIEDKLEKFIDLKAPNPLDPSNRMGKHDSIMTGALAGYWHCHLRDDAILIYKLTKRCIHLISIVAHADIEGKKKYKYAKKLAKILD